MKKELFDLDLIIVEETRLEAAQQLENVYSTVIKSQETLQLFVVLFKNIF